MRNMEGFSCSVLYWNSMHYVLQTAFEFVSVMAVITNCALVALSPEMKVYMTDYSSISYTLVFVAAEVSLFYMDYIGSLHCQPVFALFQVHASVIWYIVTKSAIAYFYSRCSTKNFNLLVSSVHSPDIGHDVSSVIGWSLYASEKKTVLLLAWHILDFKNANLFMHLHSTQIKQM